LEGGRFHAIKEINPSIRGEMCNVRKIGAPPLVLSIMEPLLLLLQGPDVSVAVKFNLSLVDGAGNISNSAIRVILYQIRSFAALICM